MWMTTLYYFLLFFIMSRLFTQRLSNIVKLCNFLLKSIFKSALQMIFTQCKSKNLVFEGAKHSKSHTNKKNVFQKLFYCDLVLKLLILFVIKKIFVNIQRKLMFSKKHHLWTPLLTKCSECDIFALKIFKYKIAYPKLMRTYPKLLRTNGKLAPKFGVGAPKFGVGVPKFRVGVHKFRVRWSL